MSSEKCHLTNAYFYDINNVMEYSIICVGQGGCSFKATNLNLKEAQALCEAYISKNKITFDYYIVNLKGEQVGIAYRKV